MKEIICKSESEILTIISEIQKENPNLDEISIRKAISSCCIQSEIVIANDTFLSCVKERIRMLKIL